MMFMRMAAYCCTLPYPPFYRKFFGNTLLSIQQDNNKMGYTQIAEKIIKCQFQKK